MKVSPKPKLSSAGTVKHKRKGGSVKKPVGAHTDPYLSMTNPADMSICFDCESVYHDKRWIMIEDFARVNPDVDAHEMVNEAKHFAVCPACHKIADGFVGGYVTMEGEFFMSHKEEVLNAIRNKEMRVMHSNPLSKVMAINEDDRKVVISTTTGKLARSIGSQLGKSFHGDVTYKWGGYDGATRVYWSR